MTDTTITGADFGELAKSSVRSDCKDEVFITLATDLVEWRRHLLELKRDVEIQFTYRRSAARENQTKLRAQYPDERDFMGEWLKYRMTQDKWKVTANRFLASIEHVLQKVNDMISRFGTTMEGDEVVAIMREREEFEVPTEVEPEAIERALRELRDTA